MKIKIEETKEGLRFTRRDGTGSMTLTEPDVTGDHYAEFGKDNAGGISEAPSDTKIYGRKDAAWVEAAEKAHTHTDADIVSTGASSGDVLTADGSGGSAWQPAAGGGGLVNFDDNAYTSSPNNTTNVSALEAKGSTTNVDFVLKPKGNGAIIAQVPDAAGAGGNKRGTYATDLQRSRSNGTKVASGQYSTIGGGSSNAASGNYAAIGGGESNTASGQDSTISGGYNNAASGLDAAIGGGYYNAVGGLRSTIGGGASNVASGITQPSAAGQVIPQAGSIQQ